MDIIKDFIFIILTFGLILLFFLYSDYRDEMWKKKYKLRQKQHLIDMIKQDEELGLYEVTLEEVAEKYANESFIPMRNSDGEVLRIPPGQTVPCGFTKHKKVAIKHFTSGYKLAQERSYSEEDMKQFGLYLGDNFKKLKSKTIDEIFEQFKKK